ncbi:hypothetical protein MKSMC1_29860 [Mycobacterium kansasii]|nr:hypothetical protein MKSMC1_29860 [Mycobacterium kansasii]
MYGDSAYADGATLDEQTARGHDMRAKVPPVRNAPTAIPKTSSALTWPPARSPALPSTRWPSATAAATV